VSDFVFWAFVVLFSVDSRLRGNDKGGEVMRSERDFLVANWNNGNLS
jgi:hypothetical protein